VKTPTYLLDFFLDPYFLDYLDGRIYTDTVRAMVSRYAFVKFLVYSGHPNPHPQLI